MSPQIDVHDKYITVNGELVESNWGFTRKDTPSNQFVLYVVHEVTNEHIVVWREEYSPKGYVDGSLFADLRGIPGVSMYGVEAGSVFLSREQFMQFVEHNYGASLKDGQAAIANHQAKDVQAKAKLVGEFVYHQVMEDVQRLQDVMGSGVDIYPLLPVLDAVRKQGYVSGQAGHKQF